MKKDLQNDFRPLLTVLLLFYTTAAFAHAETGVAGGLVSGLLHPVLGFDHLVAMVAVGLWGAQLGKPAIWLLPITFPVVMAIGALAGVADLPLPFVEFGIAGSALVLGIMVALCLKPPFWAAAVLVGLFALFHGHAHGTEVPSAVNPLAYGVGFVTATGLLHLAGILIGVLVRWPVGDKVVRACGVAVAAVGLLSLTLAFGPTA